MLGFAILLTLAYVATVAKHGATDVTAYRKGKEAPSIEKFRTRHREKADKKLTTPKKAGGKEPGPLRQWGRAVADNAAAELIERQQVKSQARRKWYSQNAPQREQQWRDKWQTKLDKRDAKLEKFKQRRGMVETPPATVESTVTDSPPPTSSTAAEQEVPAPEAKPSEEEGLSAEQAELVRDWSQAMKAGERKYVDSKQWFGLPVSVRARLLEEAQQNGMAPSGAAADGGKNPIAEADPEAAAELRRQGKTLTPPPQSPQPSQTESTPASPTTTTDTTSSTATGGTVYEQGVQELHESAEQIQQFCADMTAFADALSGRGFGTEITGAAGEVSQTLLPAGDIYADLAEQVQQAGDDIKDAHDRTGHQIPDEAAMV